VLTRCVKLSISLVWFAAYSAGRMFRRAMGQPVRGTAVLLYYHGIRPQHRASFARQMDTLLRWARPIHADSRTVLGNDLRFAGVTFDDGLQSFADSALPELEKRKIPATLFVIADQLGSFPDWPGFIPDPEFRERLLTADQLRRLPTELVRIGSHTLSHPTLTRLDEAEARRELRESRVQLEKELDRKIELFSFPHGAFNERLVDWCRESGYERVFTILPKPALSSPHEYVVGRVSAEPTDWPLEFLLKLLGAYCWLPRAFELKRHLLSIAGSARSTNLRHNAA